jgi:starch synthase
MKILFIASECVPFCKTGGLADVIGALPKELRRRRHDVRIMLPKYKTIRGQEFGMKETGEWVRVRIDGKQESADLRVAKTEKGIKTYFINHEGYFGRPGLYRDSTGDYPDNAARFGFFCRAALEACKAIEFRPDVIHVHDWQTGLVPMHLKTTYKDDAFFQHTASVFSIHNMAYQGVFPKSTVSLLGIPWTEFTPEKLEFYDQLSFLKAGLVYSDLLATVSPTYAQQIQTYEFGAGLEGVLRRRSRELVGILNGLDRDEWNPAKDPFLAKSFDAEHRAGRADCKAALQEALRLPIRPEAPVLGVVARIDRQKGTDLLLKIVPELVDRGAQLVVLGQGDRALEAELERQERRFPRAFRVRTDFNEPLAHHIYGGSDLFLMPSRFEPCGLGQMIAMRYGAVPVVARTGGLLDTVNPPLGNDTGTGFLFEPGSASAFLGAIQEALEVFGNASRWGALQSRGMAADFSWDQSAESYLGLYRRALGRGPSTRGSLKIL